MFNHLHMLHECLICMEFVFVGIHICRRRHTLMSSQFMGIICATEQLQLLTAFSTPWHTMIPPALPERHSLATERAGEVA